jgi:hypothetical protein
MRKYNTRQAYSSLLVLAGCLVVAFTRQYQKLHVDGQFDIGQLIGLVAMFSALIVLMPWKDKPAD